MSRVDIDRQSCRVLLFKYISIVLLNGLALNGDIKLIFLILFFLVFIWFNQHITLDNKLECLYWENAWNLTLKWVIPWCKFTPYWQMFYLAENA